MAVAAATMLDRADTRLRVGSAAGLPIDMRARRDTRCLIVPPSAVIRRTSRERISSRASVNSCRKNDTANKRRCPRSGERMRNSAKVGKAERGPAVPMRGSYPLRIAIP
jgi:hypothetical protein